MTRDQADSIDTNDRLGTVLAACLEAVDHGTADERAFLAQYPDFAAEITEFFANQNRLDKLAAPLRWHTQTPDLATRTLGDFRILRELGRGGMGVVYEAEQISLGRRVALKVLPFAATMDPRQLQRFHNEARAAASLEHPHIVPVYGVGCERGVHYYAMKFIDGQSLAQVIADLRVACPERSEGRAGLPEPSPPFEDSGRATPVNGRGSDSTTPVAAFSTQRAPRDEGAFRQIAEWGIQAAEALEHAHSVGIVHRDIKPANLMIDNRGILWVADFGLARTAADAGLTMTGDVIGTLRYMSPEQALAMHGLVDHRTDIYSLGVTLYEVLTGSQAVAGKDREQILNAITRDEPSAPRSLDSAIPAVLETIVLKAMEKPPGDRYATAQQLADDLRRFLDGRPICARRVSRAEKMWRWCRRYPAVTGLSLVAALLLIVGTAVSAYFALEEKERARDARDHAQAAERARKDAQRESALLALERGRNLAEQGEGGRGLLWLARGLQLATEAEDPELPRIIRTNIAAVSGRLHMLRQVLNCGNPGARCVLTPDGKKVWASSWGKNEVWLWDIATGQAGPNLLMDQSGVYALALSPDGMVLFTGGDVQSRLWDTTTSRPREPSLKHPAQVLCAAFRPDGHVLATGHAHGMVRLWDVVTGRLRAEWQGHQSHVYGAAFSPDGKTLATGSTINGTLRLWDAATGQPIGKSIPHKSQVFSLTWHPDGQTILVGNARGTAQFWDVATSQRSGQPLAHRSTIWSVDISRDGRLVATGSADRTARLWDAAGRQPVGNLLPHQGTGFSVGLGPDGKMLATASEDGLVRIWDVAPGRIELPHGSWVYAGTFSPDSRTALTACADHKVQLWDVSTGKPLGLPYEHFDEIRSVAISADGQSFFVGCDNGQVWRWVLSGSKAGSVVCSHPGVIYALAVTTDGRTIATAGSDRTARLWNAVTRQPQGGPLKHEGEVTTVAFSPDGRMVLTGSKDKTARLWDVATGLPTGKPLDHPDEVAAVAFHPDGLRFFTASRDTGVRLWDAATQELIGKPLTLERAVTSMAFSPNGQSILLGSYDGMAQVFDMATKLPLGNPFNHGRAVMGVAFSPNGRTALTASQDASARLWDVPAPLEGDPERILTWAQVITGLELKDDGSVSVLDAPTWQDRRQRLRALGGAPLGN